MAELADIRAGLAANLGTIAGVNVSAYARDNILTPALQVYGPDEVVYDLAMQRGLDMMTLVVQGLAGSPAEQARQVMLDQWLAPSGSSSVKAAIESDPTLGGVVTAARVTRASGYRVYALPNKGSTLGAEWFVEIHNPGS